VNRQVEEVSSETGQPPFLSQLVPRRPSSLLLCYKGDTGVVTLSDGIPLSLFTAGYQKSDFPLPPISQDGEVN